MAVAVKRSDSATQIFTCQRPFARRVCATVDVQNITTACVVARVWLTLITDTHPNSSKQVYCCLFVLKPNSVIQFHSKLLHRIHLSSFLYQCWQVSASTGLNLGLNRFKPSWQKQVSTRVSATLAETGFCRSF